MNYKLKSVKGAILQTISHLGCTSMEFDNIRVYFKAEPLKPVVKTIWTEKERSDGKFDNRLQNQNLRNIVEDIRELICKNQ